MWEKYGFTGEKHIFLSAVFVIAVLAVASYVMAGSGHKNKSTTIILTGYKAKTEAKLEAELTAPKHTAEGYSCEYSWSWDKMPAESGRSDVFLDITGYDSKGGDFATKKTESFASVEYYYEDGTFCEAETSMVSTDGELYKLHI